MKEFFFGFLLFFSYAVLGYIAEIIECSIHSKKWVFNRGFLIGPYLPLYGIGAFAVLLCLGKYQDDIVALFVLSCVLGSIIEYFTSFLIEKIFHIRFWDYSKRQYNLNGRICLLNTCLFGLAGVLIVKYLNPFLITAIKHLSPSFLIGFGLFFFIIFTTDLIMSIVIMFQIRLSASHFQRKDATSEVKREVYKILARKTFLFRRILKAFPTLATSEETNIQELRNVLDKIQNEKKRT